MSLLRAAPLVLRRRGGISGVLPIIAFAASTGILATVLGGLAAFISRAEVASGDAADTAGFFVTCAVVATALLVPSAMGLGGSAARLSLSRREKDLASMRLVGGTTAQIGSIAVLDVLVQALIGSVVGLALHVAVTPVVTTLDFGFERFTVGELLMPLWGYAVLVAGAVALAGVSAALGLVGVVISPLGVARDSRVVRMSVIRLLIWGALLGAFIAAFQVIPPLLGSVENGLVIMATVLVALLAMIIGSVNLVGPFVLWVIARMVASIAPTPGLLVGARRLAADPRAGWRSISGVTFGLVIAGFLTLVTTFSDAAGPQDAALMQGLSTGGYLTLAIAAILAAVSTGVIQAARVLDQAAVYRAQHVAGASIPALQRARIAEIAIPLAIAALVAGISAAGLLAPVLSGSSAILAVIQYLGAAALALVLVAISMLVSSPLVAHVARRAA